ncbi:hypothetical protein D3C87_1186730 [compost metagenome]
MNKRPCGAFFSLMRRNLLINERCGNDATPAFNSVLRKVLPFLSAGNNGFAFTRTV